MIATKCTCGKSGNGYCLPNILDCEQRIVYEEIREPIENALYATGRFFPFQATELADHILQYLHESGYSVKIEIQTP